MTVGVRDTRKIDAVVNLTESNVRDQGRFDDSIGIYPEFIDGYGVLILPTTGRYYQVPYASMLPRGVSNLLVAGRSSGGDRIAHASTRNMSCTRCWDRARAWRRRCHCTTGWRWTRSTSRTCSGS